MHRHKKINIIIFLSFFIIFLRFYYFQVHEYSKYEEKAGSNSLRSISINAPRGIIYDRNGVALVDNRQIYDLSIIPFDVTQQFNYNLLSLLTEIPTIKLKSDIADKKNTFYRFRPYTIQRHIDFETRSRLEENKLDLPGAIFSEFPARIYPNEARLTHVLGYLRVVTDEMIFASDKSMNYKSGDIFGFSGIEKMYESLLRGTNGTEYRLVDIFGIDHGEYKDTPKIKTISGENLFLTIDSDLQFQIEKIFNDKKGVVICMLPKTGEIIAYHSNPDYDLNSFVGPVPIDLWNNWNSDPERPLLNRGIQGLYPPGSTFKLLAAALAVEENIVSKDWLVDCSGVYKFGDRNFHCWNINGHGSVNLDKAIYQSCNIYFYHLIQKIKLDIWADYAKKFRFGLKTGVDLYGEKKGNIPNRSYLNNKYGKYGWAAGNLLTFIIGQGDVLVTPIQVVNLMNIISTRGNIIEPHFRKDVDSKKINISLKSGTWDYLQKTTWEVVNNIDGTGKAAKINGCKIHGKTGTAQNPHGEDHSWFTGYMSKNQNPVISLVVLVENGGKGSVQAAQISKKIFKYFKNNNAL